MPSQSGGSQSRVEPKNEGARWASALTALILLIATLVTRLPWLGDALYHEDEGFYLVFGQALHQGVVPYVGIWDRKPFGLFVLYWLFEFLPGNPVVAFQLAAGVFAFSTAWTISRIVRHLYGEVPSRLAGIVYLAAMLPLYGAGGQAPVFYNLLMALAALLLLPTTRPDQTPRRISLRPEVAMFLCGLALTIKPTALIESLFFGLFAVWRYFVRPEMPFGHRLEGIARLAIFGLLPTLLILLGFAIFGVFDVYWFATVQSLGWKTPQPSAETLADARYLGVILLPFWLTSALGAAMMDLRQSAIARFLVGWAFAAIGGFLMIPNFWDHYALPLLPSFVVLTSAVFARARLSTFWAAVVVTWSFLVSGWPASGVEEKQRQLATLVRTIDAARHGGCLYVYEGPAVLYAQTHACRVTSRLFPQHLALALEERAIGVSPETEIHHIVARHPAVIVMADKPSVKSPNLKTRQILHDALLRDYLRIATLPLAGGQRHALKMEVWALRSTTAHPLAISQSLGG